MKQYIMKLLHNASGPMSNIIYNAVQMATFNEDTNTFEIPMKNLRTSYFQDNPHLTSGVIENTPIHWEIAWEKLIIWIV